MNYMFSILSFGALACLTLNVASADVPDLKSSVSGKFVEDVSRDVAQWHNVAQPKCKFEKLVGADIVQKTEKGTTEHWTIQACEQQQFTYRVFVIHNDNGTITDVVGNVDKPALTPAEPEKK